MKMLTKRYHWIFDASGIPVGLTKKKSLIKRALKDLAKLCNMRIIAGPIVVKGAPYNPGLTGICVVDFSHISIHTFSDPREICVDVFSCRPFDPKKIHRYLLRTFRASRKNSIYLEVKYPYEKGSG
ncbi:MAG: S-adenosylmethionine decarboxylase [Candidatus Paceibacteria bacterium]